MMPNKFVSHTAASEIRIPPITELLTTIMSLLARARVRCALWSLKLPVLSRSR
jgi:hypothetical protein